YSQGTKEGFGEIKITGLEELSAAARGLHPGHDADAEEAEFCLAQSGESSPNEWPGSDRLHPGRGPQFTGTLDRPGARRTGQGFTRRALPHRARNARFVRGG